MESAIVEEGLVLERLKNDEKQKPSVVVETKTLYEKLFTAIRELGEVGILKKEI